MSTGKKALWIIGSIAVCITAYFIIYDQILYPRLIPDPCYFHNHKPSAAVELFFDFPPAENGHPIASPIAFIGTLAFGGLLGWGIVFIGSKRKTRKQK